MKKLRRLEAFIPEPDPFRKGQIPPNSPAKCAGCGCQFFELVEVHQFKASHYITLGVAPPKVDGATTFKLLRCVSCLEVHEPKINLQNFDTRRASYDLLIEQLGGLDDLL